MTRKKLSGVVCSFTLAVAVLGYAESAAAADRKVYTIILLDGSGSMLEPVIDTPSATRSKWQEGILRAQNYVRTQQIDQEVRPSSDPNWDPNDATMNAGAATYYPPASHCYAIWKFGNLAATQVYPDPTQQKFFCATEADGYTKNVIAYDTLANVLPTVPPPEDSSVQTPLAGGLCTALRKVREAAEADQTGLANVQIRRSVILETDGLENSTPTDPDPGMDCAGTSSGPTYTPDLLDPLHPGYLAWAGGLAEGSWQWKVYNMAFWDSPGRPPIYTTSTPLWGLKPGWSYLDFWTSFYGVPDFAGTEAGMVALNIDALYDYIPASAAGAAAKKKAKASLAPPPPPVSSGSFPPSLQAWVKGMSKQTGGRYQAIVYNGNALPGVVHSPAADVNDSGVVDIDDFYMLIGPNVYGRPTSDSAAAANCDINHDGFVDYHDIEVMAAQWGQTG